MQQKKEDEQFNFDNRAHIENIQTEETNRSNYESAIDYRYNLLHKQILDKDSKIAELQEQLYNLKSVKDTDFKEVCLLKEKYIKKKVHLTQSKQRTKLLEDQNQHLEAELKVFKDEKTRNQDLISQINRTIKEKDEEILKLKIQLEENISRNENSKRELQTYSKEIKDMQNFRKASHYNMENVHSENVCLKNEL